MDEEKRRVLDENNVPKPLESWIGKAKKGCEAICFKYSTQSCGPILKRSVLSGIAEVSGVPKGTIGRWRSERHDFATCLERRGDSWEITKVGHRALDINWTKLDRLVG